MGSFLPVSGRRDPDQVSSLTSQTEVEILARIVRFSFLSEATAGGSEGGGCVSYCVAMLRRNEHYVVIGFHFFSVSKAGVCPTRTTALHGLLASSPSLPATPPLPSVFLGTDGPYLNPEPAPTAHSPSTPVAAAPPSLARRLCLALALPPIRVSSSPGGPGPWVIASRSPDSPLRRHTPVFAEATPPFPGHIPYAIRPASHPTFYSSAVASPVKQPWSMGAARVPPSCGLHPVPAPRAGPGTAATHCRATADAYHLSYQTALKDRRGPGGWGLTAAAPLVRKEDPETCLKHTGTRRTAPEGTEWRTRTRLAAHACDWDDTNIVTRKRHNPHPSERKLVKCT